MQKPEKAESGEDKGSTPWVLASDVISFQFKLLLDGIRDVLLSPISLGAAIAGLILSPADPARYFRRLMKLGHRSDRWINLFGSSSEYNPDNAADPSSDIYMKKLEGLIVNEYHKGGVLQDLKLGTDQLFEKLHQERQIELKDGGATEDISSDSTQSDKKP